MKGFTRAIKNAHIKMLYQMSVKLICRIKPINEVHSENPANSVNDQPSAVRQRVNSERVSGSGKRGTGRIFC